MFVGRLEKVKNIRWLIETFAEAIKRSSNNISLLIMGEGSQRQDLEEFVKNKHLEENIKFGGWVKLLFTYYKDTACVLFPSFSEGYGLVPLEAADYGAKLIMSDVGVANYELKPSERVKIIPLSARQAWVEAILNI